MEIKPGWYRVLQIPLPVSRNWTCGDGCCSDTVDDDLYIVEGTVIWVDESQVGNETYETGSDYEGHGEDHYLPRRGIDYLAKGYLEPVNNDGPDPFIGGVDKDGYPPNSGEVEQYDHLPDPA